MARKKLTKRQISSLLKAVSRGKRAGARKIRKLRRR